MEDSKKNRAQATMKNFHIHCVDCGHNEFLFVDNLTDTSFCKAKQSEASDTSFCKAKQSEASDTSFCKAKQSEASDLIQCNRCDFYYQLKSVKKIVVDPEASCVPITKPKFVTRIYKEWVPVYYTGANKL
jgi:hypothetical protein